MAANRPPDALVAGAIILFLLFGALGRTLCGFSRWGRSPAGSTAVLQSRLHWPCCRGYALAQPNAKNFFQLHWSGVPALLVSPTRGLLVFSPFLVFIPVGLIQRLRTPGSKGSPWRLVLLGRRPGLAVFAGRLACRSVMGAALVFPPLADLGVDARTRAARLTAVRPWPAHPDGGQYRSRADDRSLLVHEDERRTHLRWKPCFNVRCVEPRKCSISR